MTAVCAFLVLGCHPSGMNQSQGLDNLDEAAPMPRGGKRDLVLMRKSGNEMSGFGGGEASVLKLASSGLARQTSDCLALLPVSKLA